MKDEDSELDLVYADLERARERIYQLDERVRELEDFVRSYCEHPDLYNGPLHNKALALRCWRKPERKVLSEHDNQLGAAAWARNEAERDRGGPS
jgi:hypothetical protein